MTTTTTQGTTHGLAGKFAPVYKDRDGNRLIVSNANFLADSESDAWNVRFAMLLFTALYGLEGTPEVLAADGEIPHFRCRYGPYDVALLSGPTFDKLRAEEVAP